MTSIRIVDCTDGFGDYLEVEPANEEDFPGHVFVLISSDIDYAGINVPIKALREALDKIEAEA